VFVGAKESVLLTLGKEKCDLNTQTMLPNMKIVQTRIYKLMASLALHNTQ
jgi:hypothetical protein